MERDPSDEETQILDDGDFREVADITVDELKECLSKMSVGSRCVKCDVDNWFYPTTENGNALVTYVKPYYKEDADQGYTLNSRMCLRCGALEQYSHAMVSYETLILRKSKS